MNSKTNSDVAEKPEKSRLNRAKTVGLYSSGLFALKVSIEEFHREWSRSKKLVSDIKKNYQESSSADEDMAFPVLEKAKKSIILSRLAGFFYLYGILLLMMPLAAWQSISHGFYSPVLGIIAFSIIGFAKMTELSFFNYQVKIGKFANFKEWSRQPSNWIPSVK